MPTSVVLFDGDCGFCTTAAGWGARRWPGVAEVVPWQRADLDALAETPERCRRELRWVGADGRHAGGAAAIGRWLWTAGGRWRVLGALALAPPTAWVAAGLYRLVAGNRQHLPGGTPACRLDPRPPGDRLADDALRPVPRDDGAGSH